MPVEIIMPKVDMDMASGKVMTWHVEEGAPVTKGAPLFDIETDKAAMEVEAEADGLVHHRVAEGTEVAIGQPVAWLFAEGEEVTPPPETSGDSPAEEPPAVEPAPSDLAPAGPQTEPSAGAVPSNTAAARATPKARALARSAGVALDDIDGSGPRGRVQAADVEALTRPVPGGLTHATAPADFAPQTGPLSVSRRDGQGVPLVMIHGFASDAKSWAPLQAQLAGRTLISIDLPSHGKSPLRRTQSFAELAADLRTAVDDLELEQFDLLGHSLGGALALSLADVRPRRLRRLTLIAPAGLGPEINAAALSGICAATRAASLAPWLRVLVGDERIVSEGYARQAMAARSDPGLRAAQQALADVLFPDGTQTFDLRAALDRVTVPTRLIWGKRDRILPWNHALQAPGRVALHLFDALGHMPQIEAPEEIGKVLRTAL